MERIQVILDYWFSGLNDEQGIDKKSAGYKRWFGKSRQTDEEIRLNFEADVKQAAVGAYQDWEKTAHGRLALIILLDQMTRNIYRDTAQMFAFDPLALNLTLRSLEGSFDQQLALIKRSFMYMPLMHAENLKVQELSLERFTHLVEDSRSQSPQNTLYFDNSRDYAQRHWAIIAQFGRFPHRNAVLGRVSTPEELEFLKQPRSSF